MDAIGIIEIYGFVCAIKVADAAAKAANVKIIAIDSNKPANAETVEVPLIMCVKMQGAVSAVEEAMEVAKKVAQECTGLI
ncbi:MAG: BMC domain-containing protein, partial [Oscillospiraceae bacterium]